MQEFDLTFIRRQLAQDSHTQTAGKMLDAAPGKLRQINSIRNNVDLAVTKNALIAQD